MFEYLGKDRRRLRRGTRAFAREVVLGDASVFVDHGFQWDGSRNVWLTRARAGFILGCGPAFDLRPRSLWNRVFGLTWRSAAIDPYFDEFFAVRTSSPGDLWGALTTRARTLMAGSFDDGFLVSDGRMVTLWRDGDFGREADAEAAAEIVAEVVGYQAAVMDTLRRLPGALYVPPSGSWSDRRPPHVELGGVELGGGAIPIRVGPIAKRGRPVIAVRAACGRATPRFEVALDGADDRTGSASRPARAAGSFTHLRPPLRRFDGLGAAHISCDGHEVTLTWPDLEAHRDRLLIAARLVGSLAAGQLGGLYR